MAYKSSLSGAVKNSVFAKSKRKSKPGTVQSAANKLIADGKRSTAKTKKSMPSKPKRKPVREGFSALGVTTSTKGSSKSTMAKPKRKPMVKVTKTTGIPGIWSKKTTKVVSKGAAEAMKKKEKANPVKARRERRRANRDK